MKRSTLSSCLISRMPNLFESSLPRGQGNIFWGTWIVEMAGSGLDWTQFKAPLFLRTSSWGNIYAGNLLWSLLASLWISHPPTVSIHMCSLALGWVSGALLAGQTHGAHESSQCEISSLDHVMETLHQHCKRISTSHRCSEEPSECGNHLTVLWKQTIPSLCQSLIHAMIPQMTSLYKIFLTQWNVCFSKLYFKLSI